jgi:methyl-accepting chemotaxis protein
LAHEVKSLARKASEAAHDLSQGIERISTATGDSAAVIDKISKAIGSIDSASAANRRFFKDRAGMAAARTMHSFNVQRYERDMGNGVIVPLKEIDAPIAINGRHWGGLRLAFKT